MNGISVGAGVAKRHVVERHRALDLLAIELNRAAVVFLRLVKRREDAPRRYGHADEGGVEARESSQGLQNQEHGRKERHELAQGQ